MTVAENIYDLLSQGWRPWEIVRKLGVSTALVALQEIKFDTVELMKAREIRMESITSEQRSRLYEVSGIIDFEKEIKRCHSCEEWKSFDAFTKNKTRWHGFTEACKVCVKEYQSNSESYKAKNKEYHKKTYIPHPRVKKVKPPKTVKIKPVTIQEQKLHRLLTHAKNRARKNGLPYDADMTFMDIEAPEYCPVIPSIKLIYEVTKDSDRWSGASLDRIKPELGYVRGNIQVMSMRANMLKNNSNDNELKAFAEWAMSRKAG